MTRDARLSALHRGGFWPGAALPSPALPPDPYSELLAARSSCLAGGVPDLPSPRLRAAAAGRHSPLRLQDRLRKTPLHERGWQNVFYIRYVVKQYLRFVAGGRQRVAPGGPCIAFWVAPENQRTSMRNPGWSPTTVMCPLQGAVSSNRNTLPGRSCLVSPSVTVMEKLPCKTMPN